MRVSVELKLTLFVVAVCVGCALGAAGIAGRIFERKLEEASVVTLQGAAREFAAQEQSEIDKLASTLDVLLADPRLREAFVAHDRQRLMDVAAPLFATLRDHDRVTHWYFIEPEPARTAFLRVHRPELHGDRVGRSTLLKAIETHDLGAGKELGLTAFALRVVRPWFYEGKVIGYVELAEEIDHFLSGMKHRTGDEYALLVKKKFLDEKNWAAVAGHRPNTWNERPNDVVVDRTFRVRGIINHVADLEDVPDDGDMRGEIVRDEGTFLGGLFPVRDATGRKVGGLFVLHDFTRPHRAMRAALVQTVPALLMIAALAVLVIWAVLHALVFARAPVRKSLESE